VRARARPRPRQAAAPTRHRRQCGADGHLNSTTMSRYRSHAGRLGRGRTPAGHAQASPAFDASRDVDVHRFSTSPIESSVAPRAASLNVTSRSPTMSAPRACAAAAAPAPGERPALRKSGWQTCRPDRRSRPLVRRRCRRRRPARRPSGSKPSGMPSAPTGADRRRSYSRRFCWSERSVYASLTSLEAFGFFLVPAGGVRGILLGQLAVRLLGSRPRSPSSETPKIVW